MKSEFYREVSNEQKMRKSTTKHKHKKQSTPAPHINPIMMSKGLKSEARSLVRSIDLNKKAKQSTNERMMRMSFSRPPIQLESDVQIPQIQEKSAVSICCKCQDLKIDHEKALKAIKMHHQEERTAFNEKYIQMEKKYLLKESQCIKIHNDYSRLMKNNEQMKFEMQVQERKILELRHQLDSSQEDLLRMYEDIKRYQEQARFFNHFLTAFVEQTRSMVQWCELFEESYQQLPTPIKTVRKDLMDKRTDLDVILKESQSYQSHHFCQSAIKKSQNSSFFELEEDCTQRSFMKYLGQNNTVNTKTKNSRVIPFTDIKDKNDFNEASTINKENIDTSNKHVFEGLIQSKVNEQIGKQKSEKMKDELLRFILTQAQSIQSGHPLKSLDSSKSNFEVDGSILSSICKKNEHYVE